MTGNLHQGLPAALMLRDRLRLQRRLNEAQRITDAERRHAASQRLATDISAAEQRVARRRAAVPPIRYPEALPVSQRRDDIAAAIERSQVVILAGETGSGKTTQLPKICLELGRGVCGLIGHTQPRRLAARTVAERIAEELETPLGGVVGYKVRFTDRVGDQTMVKLMTDGILLAEIQQDRLLHAYDTLIIDEAHERSLNVDFLLGYVHQLLPRRPDLKLIITSATIDPGRFSQHFDGAPVVEVSGRTYPVEVRYRPLAEEAVTDPTQAICDAVDELTVGGPGDVLVFLSGEREIRDTADALRKSDPTVEVLPLYARLSAADQHKVFQPHTGRRVVLATNVAETSLTVPGIRYVVDPGTARISRYSARLKVQRLPIEKVSQASADQRKGRCGRVAAGVCIRLYSPEDFLARPAFTEPEILRTNLASVILQMTALDLGEVADFPFLDPPDRGSIRDGTQLLHELGALDLRQDQPDKRLTPLGRRLAQLPVDPRLGRMVLEAERNGCVGEVTIIAAALSIQDPRERPPDRQHEADLSHARFASADSDFLALLNLWTYLTEQQEALSSGAFRRLCRAEYLHYLRIREWQDVHGQLRQVARTLGVKVHDSPAEPAAVHRALLAGLLSHIGMRDGEKREYLGARGARFAIHPGSALASKPPQWVMAAELVETSRLLARTVARIQPEWAESLADHVVMRTFSEPHWERKRGGVVAYEKVTLYGVPIIAARKVDYGRVDPAVSRELFLRHALVEGDWETRHVFWHDNRRLLEDAEQVEHRTRRRGLLADEQTLLDFYDARVPTGVVAARHFDAWWKDAGTAQPDLLTFPRALLLAEEAGAEGLPDVWRQGDLALPLSYRFEPASAGDGVTVHIPLAVLNRVRAGDFAWQVPGLRQELVTELLRSLPKNLRRDLVPVPDRARAVLAHLTPNGEPLLGALERELRRTTGVVVPRAAWQPERLPAHLRMTFRVEDAESRGLAEGKDLDALKRQLEAPVRAALGKAAGIERTGLRTWDFEALPRTVEQAHGGQSLVGYPALVDQGDSVAIGVLGSAQEQRRAHWRGVRRLLLLNAPSVLRQVSGRLTKTSKLALSRNPHGGIGALLDDCVTAAADTLIARHGGLVWDRQAFEALLTAVGAELADAVSGVLATVEQVLVAAAGLGRQLEALANPAFQPTVTDVRVQLAGLVRPGFVSIVGQSRLPDVLRYVQAMQRRLEALPSNLARDRDHMAQIAALQESYRQVLAGLPVARRSEAAVDDVAWMIEDLRVSAFAQALGTPRPVSEQRILKALHRLAADTSPI